MELGIGRNRFWHRLYSLFGVVSFRVSDFISYVLLVTSNSLTRLWKIGAMRYWFVNGLRSEEVSSASDRENRTSESVGGPNRRRRTRTGSNATDSVELVNP